MSTILTWDRPESPWVLLEAASASNAFPNFALSTIGVAVSLADAQVTSDPESVQIDTYRAMASRADLSAGRFVAVPYDLAAKMYVDAETIRSLHGEIADYQALIKGASLPIDHSRDLNKDETAKLYIDSVDIDQGGKVIGSVEYLVIDPRYAIVEKEWLLDQGVDA